MSKILKSYQVASYMRLSREDGDKVLSDSIANQKAMIADYIKEHDGLILTDEFIDDGYSGTTFDRPAFARMMAAIKAKKINCVIVKDLSRLGRNYIETGRYLENIFPMYGVRFISILDRYDNVDETGEAEVNYAGIYHTENSEQINSMRKQGMNIPEIMKATGLSKSSVHSYLPYTKMIYNVDELSLYAERCRIYRKRKQAVEQLQICKGASLECVENYLWSTIEIFSGYSFTTVKGLRFRYAVNGNEIQINRKKKSITRSSVKVALKVTLEKKGNISGPKKLEVFGASYLYPMFLRFGLIDTERKLNGHLPDMDNI